MGNPHSVVANVLDCDIVESRFELQSRFYVHFRISTLWKGMKPYIPSTMGWMVPLLLFYEDGFGFELPIKFDMQLN